MGETTRTYCSLCSVGCPAAVTVSGSTVIKLDPDHDHPQGGAVCAKGRAAPEIHVNARRLNYPLRRTNPKTAADPGWARISWDRALELIATKMRSIRDESGPQAIAFGRGTGAGSGLMPAEPWLIRLAAAFGTPNYMTTAHLCSWARDGAVLYTLGVYPQPLPDVERSGSIVLWGSNPSANFLSLSVSIIKARSKGAKLVVIDPRRAGLANKADLLLQVRPGTDGALALAFIHELIEHGWYDEAFVREWSNAPLLVRLDSQRLLRAADVGGTNFGPRAEYVASSVSGQLVGYRPEPSRYDVSAADLALKGEIGVRLANGERVQCVTVFELLAREASRFSPDDAAGVTGVPATDIRSAVRLLVENRPVSHHSWNGVIQHTNATQGARAIEVFFALLGDWDKPGGDVVPMPVRTAALSGRELSPEQAELRLGRADRPLGPPVVAPGNIAAYDLYSAILEGEPYRVRGYLAFGGNVLMNSGDSVRGRRALESLEFFAQAELFETPASRYADVLLPATTFLENETLVLTDDGFVQRRRRVVPPLEERRPDTEVIFDLACRLGHGDQFSGGNIAAAYDEVLAPANLTWDGLLEQPNGVAVTEPLRYEKYLDCGFETPTRKVELFVDRFAAHGHDGIPRYEEPVESPVSTPELARKFPVVLTNAKLPQYLHSQGRGIPALRRTRPDPTAELHPETAATYGITHGQWIVIETPVGAARAKADVTSSIRPGVVCAYHGWWEGCEELGLPAYDPFSPEGANVNLLTHNETRDPIGGAVAHRSSMCRVRPLPATAATEDLA